MKNLFLQKSTIIAVIGFGRFGKLLIDILLKHSNATIILVSSKKVSISNKRLLVKPLTDVNQADIIIPCVPISNFESIIKRLAPIIKKGAIVMDVCSVKVFPVKIMKTYLPKTTQIIASHPMFGPDSYTITGTLEGLKLVVWNISADDKNYNDIKRFFSNLGIKVLEISPLQHDKHLAVSLGHSYLIGKINQQMGIKSTPIDTYDFKLLLKHLSIVKQDTDQLFLDMQLKNPYAKQTIQKITETVNALAENLNERL